MPLNYSGTQNNVVVRITHAPDPDSFWQIVQWQRAWKRGLPDTSRLVFPHKHSVVSEPMVLDGEHHAHQRPRLPNL